MHLHACEVHPQPAQALKKELAAVESGVDLETLAAADGGLSAGTVGGESSAPQVLFLIILLLDASKGATS